MTPTPRPLRGRRLSRAVVVALAPVLVPQTVRLRREVPLLPEPPRPWEGGGGSDPIRLLVLGDSMAVGVGVDDANDGIAGHLAAALTLRTGRPVRWRSRGRNGATARDVIREALDDATAEPVDIAFISLGANDSMQVRSHRAFRRDIIRIVKSIVTAHPEAIVLVSALPSFERFDLIPEPLRGALALHAHSLEVSARHALERFPHARMTAPLPHYSDGFFATDRFHPSAEGYREWADFTAVDAFAHGMGAQLAR